MNAEAEEIPTSTVRNTNVIDLSRVMNVLAEAQTLVEDLDGAELDDRGALHETKGGERKQSARQQRVEISRDLNFLADRLTLAAALVRYQYWLARGESDPLA